MARHAALLLLIALALVSSAFSNERCGTSQILQHKKIKLQAHSIQLMCPAEYYYDSVYTRQTKHFAFFYTKQGPHATTEQFVDSLEQAFEENYTRFLEKHKTRAPKGITKTYHYRKDVPNNLYPVEVVELTMLRGYGNNQDYCTNCFGLTLQDNENDLNRSIIFMDNDFRHPNQLKAKLSTDSCKYYIADRPLWNAKYNYPYDEHFGEAIRITVAHELYHAVQCRYVNLQKNYFWIEASGMAMEEVAAPEVDDYQIQLQPLFNMNWSKLDSISNHYSLVPLHISMYNALGPTFDTKIWENFSKFPDGPFEEQFIAAANSFNKNPDSLFHDFATRLYFSGVNFDAKKAFSKDQKDWPSVAVYDSSIAIANENYPYMAYRATNQYNSELKGMGSFLLKNKSKDTFEILPINDYNDFRSKYGKIYAAEKSIFVYSRLSLGSSKPAADSTQKDKFIAYPNPWKNEGPLCFTGLPSPDKNNPIIEIRTRKGALVDSWTYYSTNHCLDQGEMAQKLAPGLYYYRAGRSGKMDKLIVLY